MSRAILIVGAGVAGLGIGWRLAQAGASVTVLERGTPASGATHAAAGMIAATAEMTADAREPEIAFAARSSALWPSFAADLEAASGMAIFYRRNGALMLGWPTQLPPGATWLDDVAAQTMVPLLADGSGAVWVLGEAQVDSRALGRALAEAFVRSGGDLRTGVTVTALEPRAVISEAGRFEADAVILAAGAWSGQVANVPLTPVKGQMIALQPPPGVALPGPVIWGNGVYLVPRDERLLVGATVEQEGYDLGLTDTARNDLRKRAEAVLPTLKDWTLVEHWAGLRPKSPDGLPLLGPLANGVFVAGGQYRNGILFAPAIADHMRDQVLGRAAVIPAFDPRRFS